MELLEFASQIKRRPLQKISEGDWTNILSVIFETANQILGRPVGPDGISPSCPINGSDDIRCTSTPVASV